MPINKVEFAELEKKVTGKGKPALDFLAPKVGKAYSVAITRDGCPACEKQKPKLDKLATALAQRHGDKVIFTRIHVKYTPEYQEESKRSKRILGHYFYPTNMILFRTHDLGAIEYYRNSSPAMSELEKSIEIAIKITVSIGKKKA